MRLKTFSESRLGPLALVFMGAAACFFALEIEFTSYRNVGREPLVLLCGFFLFLIGLGRFLRPTTIEIREKGLSIQRVMRRELFVPWQSIGGFYEKYPSGIGINLEQPVPGYKQNRWFDGSDRDEVFLFGLWSDRTATVAYLNELADNQASSSMSQ